MNMMHRLIRRRFAWLVLAGMGLFAPALALAVPYTIILKVGNPLVPVASPCSALGSFDFNKTVVGTFPVTNPQVVLSGDCSAQLGLQAGTYSGALMVYVSNVTSNGQDQGPNVVGISGNLTLNGVPFANDTTNRMTFNGGSAPQSAAVGVVTFRNAPLGGFGSNPGIIGGYYVVNNANLTVPEPGVLVLLATALGALLLVARRRSPAA